MRNARVIIFAVPRPVHVNPLLSISEVLVRRGFHVTCVTSDIFEPAVSAVGARVMRCPRLVTPNERSTVNYGSLSCDEAVVDFENLARRTISRLTPFFENGRPDLVLYDSHSFAGLILASRHNIPAVHITTQLIFKADRFEEERETSEFAREMLNLNCYIDALFREQGVALLDAIFRKELLNIYLYAKDFQICNDSGAESAFYAPRCVAERPCMHTWRPTYAPNVPAVLVSASTTLVQNPDYYLMCAEVLSNLGWHVILAIGDNNNPAQFSQLPPNCEVSKNVPQVEIMPYVQLLVCLGGMTTTMEAMYHGVPLVMLTHGFNEGELYAGNVARLGLGIHLRSSPVTADNLRYAVLDIMTNREILRQVREMQLLIRRAPGAEEVVNRIEEFLESHVPFKTYAPDANLTAGMSG